MEATTQLMTLPGGNASLLAEATNVQAVFQARRGSIIAGRQDFLVFHEDRADMPPQACRALGDKMSDIHEILFPRGPVGMSLIFLFLYQG